MKKLYTRIAACSLAVLIAFNTVAIPKSRAVVVESALSSAIIGTYLTASGFAFTGKDTAVGTPADMYIAERVDVFLRDWSEAMDKTDEEIRDVIVSGFEFVGNGVVKIGSAAAGLISSFTDWLIDKFGLEPGADPVGVVPDVSTTLMVCNGVIYPVFPEAAYDYEHQVIYKQPTTGAVYATAFNGVPTYDAEYDDLSLPSGYIAYSGLTSNGVLASWKKQTSGSSGGAIDLWFTILYSDITLVNGDGVVVIEGSEISPVEDWENPVLFASLPADYEAAPTVEEQYAMAIDTGMTIEDEQEFVDAVLGGMLAGTLAPTYTIENVAGGDVVVPDEGEDTDTQAGILSSVKNIAQNVIALPQTIAEAIKGLFVPDAALTQEITDTFSSKFGFISTLHQLGSDLASLGPDSKPPVIYIHLEDAEGAIDYGGTVKALDMSWYERYKPDGDRIIGGFLWLGFLWLLFKRTAAIIQGGEMMTEQREDLDDGYRSRRGRRK